MKLIKDTVLNNNNLTPTEFYLSQNYPNPFSEKTTIKFCVAYKTRVKLKVFDSDGKMIETLVDEEKDAGTYEVEFSTTSVQASRIQNLATGVYFYRLQAGNYVETKKMTLLS